MFVAVAGNLGSGKTTLAKLLAQKLHFTYLPQKRDELEYLMDFFDDIPRFFLSTQLAFLVNKANQIKDCIRNRSNFILDRSLDEDVYIFAKLWTENYEIDSKEKIVYDRISQFFLKDIPSPDVLIYVQCSSETSYVRIADRGKRDFESKYPSNHIENLQKKYESLISDFAKQNRFIILSINSEKYDFNDDTMQEKIIDDFLELIAMPNNDEMAQISFWDGIDASKQSPRIKESIFSTINRPLPSKAYNLVKYVPQIYIAAPFTTYATKMRESDKSTGEIKIDLGTVEYGLIPQKYKKILLNIEKALCNNFMISTILPHRDINEWGKKEIPSTEVLKNLISSLDKSNLIVAIPSDSFGVHMELGIALSRNLPMIIFEVEELKNSFFVNSFKSIENCLFIKVNKLSQVAKKLASNEVIEFIKNYLGER